MTKKNACGKKKKRRKKGFEGLPLDQMVIQCRQEADREMPEHNITKSSSPISSSGQRQRQIQTQTQLSRKRQRS